MTMSSSLEHRTGHPVYRCLIVGLVLCGLITSNPQLHAQTQSPVAQLIGSAVDNPDSYPEVARAITMYQNNDVAGARQVLDQAKLQRDELPPGGVMLGMLLLASNRQASARAALEAVIASHPNDPEPYLRFGELAFRARRFTDADLLFRQGQRLSQNFTGNPKRKQNLQILALSGLAGTAESRRQWQDMLERFQAIDTITPDNAQVQVGIARAMYKLNKVQDAYTLLGNVWNKNPNTSRPEIIMGRWYQADGKDASKMFTNAASRAKDNLNTQLAVTRWALDTGDLATASTSAQQAVNLDPNSLEAHVLMGLVGRYENNYAAAEKAFAQAHLLSPSNFAASNNLALALIAQFDESKHRKALEYAQMNTRIHTDANQTSTREAIVTLGWILYRLGREAEAVRTVQQAVRVGGITPESAYYAAEIYNSQGDAQTARRLLEPALRSTNAFPSKKAAAALLARLPAA